MTQEQKELLLKDLCGRLPYGIRVEYKGKTHSSIYDVLGFARDRLTICLPFMSHTEQPLVEDVKPYLFPLSTMTEEQKKEFDQLLELELKAINDEINHTQSTAFEVDFYHKHHLDWRELIPMGLAIDATNKNIY
jgi:hypothetical protein